MHDDYEFARNRDSRPLEPNLLPELHATAKVDSASSEDAFRLDGAKGPRSARNAPRKAE
jgi:hypothetical protein